jgi:hypothetical protein
VTEQDLDDPDVGTAFQKVGGKAVPQRMGGHTPIRARRLAARQAD